MTERFATALSDEVDQMASGAVLPRAPSILRDARRRHRTRMIVTATLAAAATGVAAVAIPALIDRPDQVEQFADGSTAPATPDEQTLHDAFAALSPSLELASITAVQPASLAAGQFGDQDRGQSAGVTGESVDKTVSVTWVVLTPALTAQEADRIARDAAGPRGGAAVSPVVTGAAQDGAVRSLVYRLDDGSFVRIFAWSDNGGLAYLTTGAGATTSDARLAELEATVRLLIGTA